jgi:hypothetical protein
MGVHGSWFMHSHHSAVGEVLLLLDDGEIVGAASSTFDQVVFLSCISTYFGVNFQNKPIKSLNTNILWRFMVHGSCTPTTAQWMRHCYSWVDGEIVGAAATAFDRVLLTKISTYFGVDFPKQNISLST